MSFQGPIYTDAGKALHNRLIGTGTLKFTKMQMGDGSLGGITIAALTALINPLVTMEVQQVKQYSDYIVVTAPFTNAAITAAFNWREIGLFAADPDYPDDRTKDILFCYQNAYSSAAPIPPGSQEFIERLVNIPIKLSDVSDVMITISTSLIYALKNPLTGKIYPDDIPDLNYISMAQKGAANGVASLDANGKVTPSQVDFLLKSIVAAADYDPASTYAAGEYCIKAGTLNKCTTPITVAEAWNAAHWTATTVAAELLAIVAALAGKVNKYDPIPSGITSCDDLPDGIYGVYVNADNLTNIPTETFNGKIIVSLDNKYFQLAIDVVTNSVFTRSHTGTEWTGWVKLAAATPPTEYDLPLASGISNIAGYTSTYCKDQFGRVTVNLLINHSDNSVFNTWHEVVATLPVGYRPKDIVNMVGIAVSDTTSDSMGVAVISDGTIHVYPFTTTQVRVTCTFELLAEN